MRFCNNLIDHEANHRFFLIRLDSSESNAIFFQNNWIHTRYQGFFGRTDPELNAEWHKVVNFDYNVYFSNNESNLNYADFPTTRFFHSKGNCESWTKWLSFGEDGNSIIKTNTDLNLVTEATRKDGAYGSVEPFFIVNPHRSLLLESVVD